MVLGCEKQPTISYNHGPCTYILICIKYCVLAWKYINIVSFVRLGHYSGVTQYLASRHNKAANLVTNLLRLILDRDLWQRAIIILAAVQ